MKFRPFALLAFAVAVGAVACSEEIAGLGEPFAIVADRSTITAARNVGFSVSAYTVDPNNRRIPGALAGTIAGVTLDSTVYVQELSETRFFMKGTAAVAAPGADLVITGHGLTDTTHVIIN